MMDFSTWLCEVEHSAVDVANFVTFVLKIINIRSPHQPEPSLHLRHEHRSYVLCLVT